MTSKLIKKHLISNFGGGVNSYVASVYLGEGFVPDSFNIDFSLVPGAARKRKGYTRVNTAAALNGDITGIYQTYLNSAWVQLVAAGTKLYSWDGVTTFSDLGGTFTDGKNYYWDFCTTYTAANGFVIFATNGQDQIQKYDGTTLSAISITEGYNYFKCSYLAHFKNYCIFANTWEGGYAADNWVNTAGNIWRNDTESVVLEVAEVHDGTVELTRETATPTTPGIGEFGISANKLYVYHSGSPGASHISITYKCKERVRWADAGDAQDYNAANFNDVVSSAAGKAIVRILPLRDLLIIYKEDSIWAMYHTGDSTAPFGFYAIDENCPCYAGWSVVDVKGEHYFLSKQGIMKTDGSKVDPVLVSKNVPSWFQYATPSGWKYAYAASNERLKQYRLLLPLTAATGSTDNTREIRYDYESDVWSIHGYNTPGNVIAVMQVGENLTWDDIDLSWDEISDTWDGITAADYPRFFTGCYNGYLRKHDGVEYDQESTNKEILAWFYTRPINLAEGKEDIAKNKSLRKVRMLLDNMINSEMTVAISKDGGRTFTTLGNVDLDAVNDAQFIGKLDMLGSCKELIYKIGNLTASSPFAIYWLETEYILRSEL